MGSIASWFGGGTVSAFVDRARKKLAAGKLDEAAKIVERGLEHFPASNSLLDLRLSLKRARAHKPMRKLEDRIAATNDPIAFEKLIDLYRELELPDEARRKATWYCEAHPERDTPHMVLGEMDLETFLEELSARHGHSAHMHLVKAANLNALSLQPRLLLAELYFCIGADRSLATIRDALRALGSDTPEMDAAREIMEKLANPEIDERIDGLFERIEYEGELLRDPADWPLSRRGRVDSRVIESRAEPVAKRLVEAGMLSEIVMLRRDGSLMTYEDGTGGTDSEGTLIQASGGEPRFVGVVRTVGRKVFPQAREFDMGRFKRCAIRGTFGNVVVGRIGNVVVGVRGPNAADPLRMWEQVSVELETVCGGAA